MWPELASEGLSLAGVGAVVHQANIVDVISERVIIFLLLNLWLL